MSKVGSIEDEVCAGILSDLAAAVSCGDAVALKGACQALDIEECITVTRFPATVFRALLGTMRNPLLHAMTETGWLFLLFEVSFGSLNLAQRTALLRALEDVFPKLASSYACFVISEILGEQYSSRRGLGTVQRLLHESPEMARRFLPHSLEHMARSDDRAVAVEALRLLHDLAMDADTCVREEVEVSMERLRARDGSL